jgi:hypothetical protein
MIRRQVLPAAVVLSLIAVRAHAAPVVIAGCGMTITAGVLAGDLDCSAATGFAVTVSDGGSLDLAGHQLIGTSTYSVDYMTGIYGGAVQCLGECTVTGGGGAVVGPPGAPGQTWHSTGIYSDPQVRGSIVHLQNTTISGWSAYGVVARDVDVTNCQFTGNTYGLVAIREVMMEGCTFTGNSAEGAHLFTGEVHNSTFDGNGLGFYVLKRLKAYSVSASNNQHSGYWGLKIRAEDSAFDGNCIIPDYNCADVLARRPPRLINSSCGTSYNDVKGNDWNICSED